ncbi:hypothetical protein C497_15792 [Halalkalicoccus jeotgali B3]|nr:hypothetical protein C497_15792 [Halalkalicoccus jeotgali B3]
MAPLRNANASRSVGARANTRRWYALRYLRTCRYPVTIPEVGEYVAPRVGLGTESAENALRTRDVPALGACGAIEYDRESGLVCLDGRLSFADRVRRAIAADALTHLRPPRLTRNQDGVFY